VPHLVTSLTYKGRVWVTNTWNKTFHNSREARCVVGGCCTCIRCLIEKTIHRDSLAGPPVLNSSEEDDGSLVGLYLKVR
jgi:hypothetical protein